MHKHCSMFRRQCFMFRELQIQKCTSASTLVFVHFCLSAVLYKQGYKNPGQQVAVVTTFLTVAPNI